LLQLSDRAVGILRDSVDHLETVIVNDVEYPSLQGFFNRDEGVLILYVEKCLLRVLVDVEDADNSGLNPAIYNSLLFFYLSKQIIEVIGFFTEVIIFIYFQVVLAFECSVVLYFFVIFTHNHC
jgi:hypothetical protein